MSGIRESDCTIRLVGTLPGGDTSPARTVGECHLFKPATGGVSD